MPTLVYSPLDGMSEDAYGDVGIALDDLFVRCCNSTHPTLALGMMLDARLESPMTRDDYGPYCYFVQPDQFGVARSR